MDQKIMRCFLLGGLVFLTLPSVLCAETVKRAVPVGVSLGKGGEHTVSLNLEVFAGPLSITVNEGASPQHPNSYESSHVYLEIEGSAAPVLAGTAEGGVSTVESDVLTDGSSRPCEKMVIRSITFVDTGNNYYRNPPHTGADIGSFEITVSGNYCRKYSLGARDLCP